MGLAAVLKPASAGSADVVELLISPDSASSADSEGVLLVSSSSSATPYLKTIIKVKNLTMKIWFDF
jgi:hypothetical protein